MGVRINNKGSTHTIAELFVVLDYANKIQKEIATREVDANYKDNNIWTIEFKVKELNYSATVDFNDKESASQEIESLIVEAKLSNI